MRIYQSPDKLNYIVTDDEVAIHVFSQDPAQLDVAIAVAIKLAEDSPASPNRYTYLRDSASAPGKEKAPFDTSPGLPLTDSGVEDADECER